jgi:hypothetical protein
VMHEATPRGSLLVNGQPVTHRQLAGLAGISLREVNLLFSELEASGVFSREDNGTVYSRRIRRDEEKAARDKANGKGGGNPKLKEGVNPPDKAQIPEAREPERKEDAAGAAPDNLEKQLFARGKQVCGPAAGGLISKLLKAKGSDVALARAAVEMAATKQNPREYIGAIITGGNASPDGRRLTNDEEYWGVGRIPGIV